MRSANPIRTGISSQAKPHRLAQRLVFILVLVLAWIHREHSGYGQRNWFYVAAAALAALEEHGDLRSFFGFRTDILRDDSAFEDRSFTECAFGALPFRDDLGQNRIAGLDPPGLDASNQVRLHRNQLLCRRLQNAANQSHQQSPWACKNTFAHARHCPEKLYH